MPTETNINLEVEHLFRRNAGQMTAVLSRIFGLGHLDLIEDAIQESLIKALRHWRFKGVPQNPKAWLIRVAKNHIIDSLRRGKRSSSLDDEARQVDEFAGRVDSEEGVFFEKEIREDQLQMIFACCHPSIPADSQVALTLKAVGGFSTAEIASAFLARKEAVAKMLVRAKRRLRERGVRLEMPVPDDIPARLDSVLKVLYLMFNEGYTASCGETLVRKDLCFEAIRLGRLLAEHPLTSLPKVHALVSLFLFQASRIPARWNELEGLNILSEQDRKLWDGEMIGEGLRHFRKSAQGDELTDYHLEAEIASHHVLAGSFESTNWRALLESYEELMRRRPSPIVALNRLIALAEVKGAGAALTELNGLRDEKLEAYYPFHITMAEMYSRTDRPDEAVASYERAARLIENDAVRDFVDKKIRQLKSSNKYTERTGKLGFIGCLI